MKTFTAGQLEAIAQALGDTDNGFTGSEIKHLLRNCRIKDTHPDMTKWKRLFNALAFHQNKKNNYQEILKFIEFAMEPVRYSKKRQQYESMREVLNDALLFAGFAVNEAGKIGSTEKAETLNEAKRRARALRADLQARNAHPDVLKFCDAEFVANDYFHAALEISKSIADKLRKRTHLTDDGTVLANHTLDGQNGKPPVLAINAWKTDSEKSEQRGFLYLVKGVFSMFRNPTAHDPRIQSVMDEADVEDLLSLASLIHRRLDKAKRPQHAETNPL